MKSQESVSANNSSNREREYSITDQSLLEIAGIDHLGWSNIRGVALLKIFFELAPAKVCIRNVVVCAGHFAISFEVKQPDNESKIQDKGHPNRLYTIMFDALGSPEPTEEKAEVGAANPRRGPSVRALRRFVGKLLQGRLEKRYLRGMLVVRHVDKVVGAQFFVSPHREATSQRPEASPQTALLFSTVEPPDLVKLWQWDAPTATWIYLNRFSLGEQSTHAAMEVVQVAFCMGSYPRRLVWVERMYPSIKASTPTMKSAKLPGVIKRVLSRSIEFELSQEEEEDGERLPHETEEEGQRSIRVGAAVTLLSEKANRVLPGKGGVWIVDQDNRIYFHDFSGSRLAGLHNPEALDLATAQFSVHDITGDLCALSTSSSIYAISLGEHGLVARRLSSLKLPAPSSTAGTLQVRGFIVLHHLAVLLTTEASVRQHPVLPAENADVASAACLFFDICTGQYIEKLNLDLLEGGIQAKNYPLQWLTLWRSAPCPIPNSDAVDSFVTTGDEGEGQHGISQIGVLTPRDVKWVKLPPAIEWAVRMAEKIGQGAAEAVPKSPALNLHAASLAQELGESGHALAVKTFAEAAVKAGRTTIHPSLTEKVPLTFLMALGRAEMAKGNEESPDTKLKNMLETSSQLRKVLSEKPDLHKRAPSKYDEDLPDQRETISRLLRKVDSVDLIFESALKEWEEDPAESQGKAKASKRKTVSVKDFWNQKESSSISLAASSIGQQDDVETLPQELYSLLATDGAFSVDPHLLFLCVSPPEENSMPVFEFVCRILYTFRPGRLHPFVQYIERFNPESKKSKEDDSKEEKTPQEEEQENSEATNQTVLASRCFYRRALCCLPPEQETEAQENGYLSLLMELEQYGEIAHRLARKKRWKAAMKLLQYLKQQAMNNECNQKSYFSTFWSEVFHIFLSASILENNKSFVKLIIHKCLPPHLGLLDIIENIKGQKDKNRKNACPIETFKFCLADIIQLKKSNR